MKFLRFSIVLALAFTNMNVIFAEEPPTLTIQQIQQGNYTGQRVRVIGVAPAPTSRWGYTRTFILDQAGGPWSGIMVFDANERLAAEKSDICNVVGLVEEYFDKTEINCTSETEFAPAVTGQGAIPAEIEVTCANADSEMYESCLIMIRNAEVEGAPDQYGLIPINDGTGEFTLLLRMADPVPAIGTIYDCLTGINDYSFEEFRIRPRDEDDWTCGGTSPTPTPTPDVPTPTPGGPTPTPSPTPSGGACDPSLSVFFQGRDTMDCFISGDTFHCKAAINNQACEHDKSVDLYVVLEVTGLYFFWPSFSQYPTLDKSRVTTRAGDVTSIDIIPAFTWPDGVGSLNGLYFYGFMTVPDSMTLIGDLAILPFCYQ